MKSGKNTVIKLTGSNNTIKFSNDGTIIAVGGYDGGINVFDVYSEKSIFKTKVKGPKRDIIINNIDISCDNKYFAFSCLSKVFVVELLSKNIIKEISYNLALERQKSIPFCFFNQKNAIALPNGEELILYSIEEDRSTTIPLPTGAGTTEMIDICPNDKHIAYKSINYSICDKLFIYNIYERKLLNTIELPYEYIPGQQMYSAYFRFIENNSIAVVRQSYGLSVFDIQTAEEIKAVTWKTMGFRSMASYNYRISNDARYLLINKQKAYDDNYDLADWSVAVGDCSYVVYDTLLCKSIYSVKNGFRSADFNMKEKLIAIQHYDWEKEKRDRQSLKIFELNEN